MNDKPEPKRKYQRLSKYPSQPLDKEIIGAWIKSNFTKFNFVVVLKTFGGSFTEIIDGKQEPTAPLKFIFKILAKHRLSYDPSHRGGSANFLFVPLKNYKMAKDLVVKLRSSEFNLEAEFFIQGQHTEVD
jgi:hypothetical protein